MHRRMKQDLQEMKFKCSNESCESIDCYKEAINHITKCDRVIQPCRLGCGLGLLGKDMEFHCDTQCSEKKTVCETCEENIHVNRAGAHDCMATMKKNLEEARAEIASLKA